MATDLEKKVIKQVEYYFGDCNLPRDRFLQEQIKLDDGWVTMETMMNFNRLKQITEDTNAIVESLRKSTSGLMEVSEDGTKIRRNPEKSIPKNDQQYKDEMNARTIYAKVFPLDASLDSLQEFFEAYGEVENLYRRKDIKKNFKGSVFVTYKTEEGMKKFLDAESVKFGDKELERRLKKVDYDKEKQEEKQQRQNDRQKKKDKATNRQKEDESQKIENEMPEGAILCLKGLSENTSREDIKNMLQDYGPIAWVDFDRGDTECFVRYDQENKAKEVLEKVSEAMGNEITLHDSKLEGSVLEGEEAVEKWKKMYEDSINRRKNKFLPRHKQKRPHGKFGKRASKRVRDAAKEGKTKEDEDDDDDNEGGDSDDEPEAKQAKSEQESPAKRAKTEEDTSEEPPAKQAKVTEEANGD